MEKKEWEKLKHINKEASEINKAVKAVTKQYRENLREYKKADPNDFTVKEVMQDNFNETEKYKQVVERCLKMTKKNMNGQK